jgi:hypothetical protein
LNCFIASNLEEKQKILVDEASYKGSRSTIKFKTLSPIRVKGKEKPIPVFLPTAIDTREMCYSVQRSTCRPLVGREHEINSILKLFEDFDKQNSTYSLCIVGHAGCGKRYVCMDLNSSEVGVQCFS